MPVVTTLMAKGAFPETHELFFGWPGMHGAKWSNWAMNKSDLLVAVGARFDDRVTGQAERVRPGATVVHLDIDSAEIGKLREADMPVVGPLKDVLAGSTAEIARTQAPAAPERRGVAAPARGVARRVPAPLRRRRRHAEAAARARDAQRR